MCKRHIEQPSFTEESSLFATFDEMVDKFKENNYKEIWYITGMKRFYIKGVR